MPQFLVPAHPGLPSDLSAGRVHDFLERNDYPVIGVSVIVVAPGLLAFVVEGPEDPTALLASFTNQPTRREEEREARTAALVATLQTIKGKGARQNDAERAVLQLFAALRDLIGNELPPLS